MLVLPGSFNLKWSQAAGFRLVEFVFDDGIYTAAAGAFPEGITKRGQVFGAACGNDFDMTTFSVPHPSAQTDGSSLTVHVPAKTYSLHTAFDKVMTDHRSHGEPMPVFQMMGVDASRGRMRPHIF